uniref:non-specific serine/threonine protein kinase n=1 Tax=Oryza barthii TaxID=65489 RepID=A0A0D3FUM7_9ORYZ
MACVPVFIFLLLISFCRCDDQLTQGKPLISPNDVLVSKGGIFALGFFSPGSSNTSLFLGIWYYNIPERTYVWVANHDNPITTPSSAMLAISNSSNLALSDSRGHTLDDDDRKLVLQLPDNTTIWQSFDHPTDTVLPNIKFLVSQKTQVQMRLVALKSPDDPSTVVNTEDEFYVMYTTSDASPYARITLDYNGDMKSLSWNSSLSSWAFFPHKPMAVANDCDHSATATSRWPSRDASASMGSSQLTALILGEDAGESNS